MTTVIFVVFWKYTYVVDTIRDHLDGPQWGIPIRSTYLKWRQFTNWSQCNIKIWYWTDWIRTWTEWIWQQTFATISKHEYHSEKNSKLWWLSELEITDENSALEMMHIKWNHQSHCHQPDSFIHDDWNVKWLKHIHFVIYVICNYLFHLMFYVQLFHRRWKITGSRQHSRYKLQFIIAVIKYLFYVQDAGDWSTRHSVAVKSVIIICNPSKNEL